MTAIRALLFDKDGTLFDFQRTWGPYMAEVITREAGGDGALMQALAAELDFDLAVQRFRKGSPVIAGTSTDVTAAMARVLPGLDRAELAARLNAGSAEVSAVPVIDLGMLFGGLRAKGLPLGIATNDAEAAARANLSDAGIAQHFDFIAGYDSGHGEKPAPGPLLAFSAAVGVAPDAVAMVGDSTHDLRAAQAAGMVRVAVLTGVATASDLRGEADVVLPDIGHLPDWLALRGA